VTIYLVALFGLMLYGACKNHNTTNRRRKIYTFVAFACLALIAMLRSYNVGRDLQSHYYKTFLRVVNMDWNNLFTLGYENGYLVFYKLISMFTDNGQWMIAIHALFVIGITGWFIYRNSENVVMSTFLFITTNTWFMYMTMMRQAMAVCIVLIALEIWKRKDWKIKRYVLFVAIVILAMQFHSSAFIAFFMPIFDFLPFKRKHIFISTLVMIASFALYNQMFKAVSFLQIGKRDYTEFYSSSGEAINKISLYFVFVYVLIFAIGTLSLVYYNKKMENQSSGLAVTDESGFSNSFLLYMVLILAVCRITGLKINIMARMTYYFMPFVYVLLPRSINCFQNINNKKIVKLTMYFFMTAAFIWLTYSSAASMYGTVPYQFFWEK
jgi:hypothetical protein